MQKPRPPGNRDPYAPSNNRRRSEIICRCNSVTRETIETAIKNGAHTLNEIFDTTQAGVGPCGGSCRRKLGPLLQHFMDKGEFPEKIVEDRTGKSDGPAKKS